MNGISVGEFCSTYSIQALFDSGAVDKLSNLKMCEPVLYYGTMVIVFSLVCVGAFLFFKKNN